MPRSERTVPILLSLVSIVLLVVTPVGGADISEDQTEPAKEGEAEGPQPTPPQIILKTQKAPVYPPAAEAARFEGRVTIELTVMPDGSVGDARVVECTHPRIGFEEASIKAVKTWKFEPAVLEGVPVEYVMQFNLSFRSSGPGRGSDAYVTFGAAGAEDSKATWRDQSRRTSGDTTRQKTTTQSRRPSGR